MIKDKIILDASAILVLINNEKGKDVVEQYLNNALISTINFSEVITVTNRNGFDQDEISNLLKNIFPNIIDFNYDQALIAASLDQYTSKFGLSLGDRACLSLAKYKNCPILTADKIWKKLDIDLDIKLIR
jgi:PIN domain nuclease of toxin-antitoxin system